MPKSPTEGLSVSQTTAGGVSQFCISHISSTTFYVFSSSLESPGHCICFSHSAFWLFGWLFS